MTFGNLAAERSISPLLYRCFDLNAGITFGGNSEVTVMRCFSSGENLICRRRRQYYGSGVQTRIEHGWHIKSKFSKFSAVRDGLANHAKQIQMNHKKLMMIIPRVLRAKGIGGILQAAVWRVVPAKPRTLSLCADLVKEQHGLEIGGPSPLFMRKGGFPIYPHVARLDNCNFTHNTIWENNLTEGFTFKYDQDRPAGCQYVSEATDLKGIPAGTFDFVLSSHAIEHTANPIRAIREWLRVLQPDGKLLLVTPHLEGTFDHRRPITDLKHLIEDDQRKTGEEDMTHLPEILNLYDLDRDWDMPDLKAFKERCERNLELRCLHHHVFDTRLVVDMLDYMGLQILDVEAIRPFHIIVAARKLPEGMTPKNQPFLGSTAQWRQDSPFKMDHT